MLFTVGGNQSIGEAEENYQLHKQNVTKDFKRNKIPLLVCTKAFEWELINLIFATQFILGSRRRSNLSTKKQAERVEIEKLHIVA